MKNKWIYIVLGAAVLYGGYKLLKKARANKVAGDKTKTPYKAPNLQVAQQYFDKIQLLYGSVPKGSPLPKSVSDQVVKYMVEIENNGFTVKDNQLVKQVYS